MTRGQDFTDGGGNSVGARLAAYVALAGTAAAGAAIALRRRRARDAALAAEEPGVQGEVVTPADRFDPGAGASTKPYPGSPLDDGDQIGRAGTA